MTDVSTPGAAELGSVVSVAHWFESAGFDADPEARQARLGLLADFCAAMGQSPDELVAGCLRTTKTGGTGISAKGRNAMQAAIEDFVAARGLSGREAVATGNTIRGFLIHNGVFIQGPAWRG